MYGYCYYILLFKHTKCCLVTGICRALYQAEIYWSKKISQWYNLNKVYKFPQNIFLLSSEYFINCLTFKAKQYFYLKEKLCK